VKLFVPLPKQALNMMKWLSSRNNSPVSETRYVDNLQCCSHSSHHYSYRITGPVFVSFEASSISVLCFLGLDSLWKTISTIQLAANCYLPLWKPNLYLPHCSRFFHHLRSSNVQTYTLTRPRIRTVYNRKPPTTSNSEITRNTETYPLSKVVAHPKSQ
jgi:hypothetical protein